jgi:hypothetical protein
MGLESSFNFIDDLDSTNPASGDNPNQGDDHLRGIKNAVQGSFPNLGSAAVTATAAELNLTDGLTKTTAELNNSAILTESALTALSGSSVNIGSIPAGTKRITISIAGATCSSTGSAFQLQLGDSGGIETSGYSYCLQQQAGTIDGVLSAASTSNVNFGNFATGSVVNAIIDLVHMGGNQWIASFNTGDHGAAVDRSGTGSKTLSAELTQFQLSCTVGTLSGGNVKAYYTG